MFNIEESKAKARAMQDRLKYSEANSTYSYDHRDQFEDALKETSDEHVAALEALDHAVAALQAIRQASGNTQAQSVAQTALEALGVTP